MPYKMKYWREYFLLFGETQKKTFWQNKFGDLDKIISYVCLNWQLKIILMCMCCTRDVVDMEPKASLQNICLYPPFL